MLKRKHKWYGLSRSVMIMEKFKVIGGDIYNIPPNEETLNCVSWCTEDMIPYYITDKGHIVAEIIKEAK